MGFSDEFLQYLREHTLVGIRGGEAKRDFLQIWMVEVEGRVFARSWGKSERSWFTAFLESGLGAIRYGDRILEVKGRQLVNDLEMMQKIDQAYLNKYTQPENIPYAKGITQAEYINYTMEFSPI